MENNYILYVGMDSSKGKADAAILKVSDRRSIKPKFLRKKLSFKFVKSEVTSFLETVRSYSDDNCTSICFALEVTGIYSTNVYNFIKANLNDTDIIRSKKSILKKSTVSSPNVIVYFLNFNMFSNLNQLLLSLSYLHILRHMIS